jgi:hypothetical protein
VAITHARIDAVFEKAKMGPLDPFRSSDGWARPELFAQIRDATDEAVPAGKAIVAAGLAEFSLKVGHARSATKLR